MSSRGLYQAFKGTWILDGVRTPMVDYQGAFADANPIDLGIKVAREVCKRSGIAASAIDTVLAGNMAPGGFDQFYLPRHIGLYAGVPCAVGAIMVQRICGTGFELFRQAGEQIAGGAASLALVVGTESMTRNPIAAFEHRQGFKLGMAPQFKDYMWEALTDPAPALSMIHTAENLAKKYGITREQVDAFASESFARAVAAQQAGFFDGEIVPVASETFELAEAHMAASTEFALMALAIVVSGAGIGLALRQAATISRARRSASATAWRRPAGRATLRRCSDRRHGAAVVRVWRSSIRCRYRRCGHP